jgi:hypothetical protein
LQLDKLASFCLLYLRQTQKNPNLLLQDISSKPGKYLKTSQDSPPLRLGLADIMMEREWRCDKASKEKEYMQLMDLVQGYQVSPVQHPSDQLYGECLDKKPLWLRS